MTDIEQKAREVVKPHCTESDDHDYPQSECRKCSQMAEEIAAAIQSAVEDEREECAKIADTLDIDINGGEYTVQAYEVAAAIRARGQAKEKP